MRLGLGLTLASASAGFPLLTVSPNTAQTTVARKSITFTPSGGSGSYSYSVPTNNSGSATFVAGVYTPGATGNVDDIVRVTDTVTGNHVDVTVHVWSPLNLGAAVTEWWNETVSVSTWTDDKGAHNYSQATGANQPTVSSINGHPSLNFAGSPHTMSFAAPAQYTTALTVWGVFKASSLPLTGGTGAYFPGNNSFASFGFWIGGDWTAANSKITFGHAVTTSGKYARSDNALADNAVHRYIGTWDGTTYTLYIDGVAQATTGTDTTALTGLGDSSYSIGGHSSAAFMTGDLGQAGAMKSTCIAGTISDTSTDLGKLDLFLKTWAGM